MKTGTIRHKKTIVRTGTIRHKDNIGFYIEYEPRKVYGYYRHEEICKTYYSEIILNPNISAPKFSVGDVVSFNIKTYGTDEDSFYAAEIVD